MKRMKRDSAVIEVLEGRRLLSVGDILPNGDGTGTAPTQLTQTTIAQGNQTLTITGSSVERLNSDSSVDTTFGSSGETTLPFTPLALGLTPDGHIIAAGLNGAEIDVAELDANGGLEPTYGNTGTMDVPLTGTDSYTGLHLVIDSNANLTLITHGIVPGGEQQGNSNSGYVEAVRLTSAGSVDTTYGTNGFITSDNSAGPGVTVLPDGGLLLIDSEITGGQESTDDATYVDPSGNLSLVGSVRGVSVAIEPVMRVNDDYYLFTDDIGTYTLQHFTGATTDTTFGRAGTVNLNRWLGYNVAGVTSVGVSAVNGVAVESNGQLLVAYEANLANAATGPAAALLNSNGAVDTSFGTDGFVLLSVGNTSFTPTGNTAVAILSNGDFTVDGEDRSNSPITDTFQGTDKDVNPVASNVSFAASIGLRYAYVTVEFDSGTTPLTSDALIDHSLIVASSTGIQAAASISSITGGGANPLEVTYVFRIDHKALLRPDNGLYAFIVEGDAAVDDSNLGNAGGMAEYSLYIAPRNRGQAHLTQVLSILASAPNIRPASQMSADDLKAQDQSVLAD